MARKQKKRPQNKQLRPKPPVKADSAADTWLDEVPHPLDEGSNQAHPSPVSTAVSPLFTVREVCSFLKVSRSTLQRMEKAGELPGRVKLGGQIRYHRETLEKWLLERVEQTS